MPISRRPVCWTCASVPNGSRKPPVTSPRKPNWTLLSRSGTPRAAHAPGPREAPMSRSRLAILSRVSNRLSISCRPSLKKHLTGGERDRFERTYRELRAAVHQEQLAVELARLAFADHLLNVVSLSFARGLDPMSTAHIYFGLSEHLEFASLEGAIDSINSSNRWERLAARDLRAELTWARTQLCCSLLDQKENLDAPIADRIARGRERRAAEVIRQMADLRTLPSIGLPPLQVVVRTLARLASNA